MLANGTELLPITCLPVERGWTGTEVDWPNLLCMHVGAEGRAGGCWEVTTETG